MLGDTILKKVLQMHFNEIEKTFLHFSLQTILKYSWYTVLTFKYMRKKTIFIEWGGGATKNKAKHEEK
jgi:hypothetical protein